MSPYSFTLTRKTLVTSVLICHAGVINGNTGPTLVRVAPLFDGVAAGGDTGGYVYAKSTEPDKTATAVGSACLAAGSHTVAPGGATDTANAVFCHGGFMMSTIHSGTCEP